VIVTIIVALDEAGTIGRDGQLPWHLPDDLRRFKAATMGHVLVMGRRTCDSIGRALPGRRSVVLSRDPSYRPPEGVERARDFSAALALVADVDWDAWSLVEDELHPADERHAFAFSFRRFVRRI
jgi:dihydrofolate reductase